LQIQGKWYQNKNPKKKPKTILHPYYISTFTWVGQSPWFFRSQVPAGSRPEAFQAPKPPGGGKTTTERRQIRQRYVQSAKQSAQKPSKGGPGATTVLPPSV
jgi:hypothetical protein